MLPHRCEAEEDYRARFRVLEKFGVLKKPVRSKDQPLKILNREVLLELSFAFFLPWMFSGILNKSVERVRGTLVSLKPDSPHSLAVFSEKDTNLAPPGRGNQRLLLDDKYFHCPLDASKGVELTLSSRVLCPVLNKLRYNLGHAEDDVSMASIPQKSETCCASTKQELWKYLDGTLIAEPHKYGSLLGGSVVPLDLPSELLAKYATGVESGRSEADKLFDETLLWFAMEASEMDMGLAHVTFTKPFLANEIDFVIYETAGQDKPDGQPPDGWRSFIRQQALCIFETTVGHKQDAKSDQKSPKSASPKSGDAEQQISDAVDQRAVGHDHPKNKLVNFLALSGAGFRRVDYHYISVTGSSDRASDALHEALRGTSGFHYWSLAEQVPTLMDEVLNHFDRPIRADRLREWHRLIVTHVENAARSFKKEIVRSEA